MAGKKDRFIYQLWKDGIKVDEGTSSYLADKYITGTSNIYQCYKLHQKYIREFDVTRYYKDWKPEQNEEYWYCTRKGVFSAYFDIENYTDLARYWVKNCFQTKEKAQEEYPVIVNALRSMYFNS